MNIAILGWGSLIWCPGALRIRTRWRLDGPPLPIEFARISQDGRLTLVIHPGAADQPTYWALSELADLDTARKNLQARERTTPRDIHSVLRDGSLRGKAPAGIAEKVTDWLSQREGIDAVAWTGLESNWQEKRGCAFNVGDARDFLLALEAERDQAKAAYDRAREYLTHAPAAVQTAVRETMRARGWNDVSLASTLFEPGLVGQGQP